MAAAGKKITYTAAEVAELIRPLAQSVELLQKENAELKRKLEHMNEVFANAQRSQYGQSSEKKSYVLNEDQPPRNPECGCMSAESTARTLWGSLNTSPTGAESGRRAS